MSHEKENAHKDHRSRLKRKVKEHGLNCLEYHEILELLLTYTIPRRDTNPIAHKLIDRFGSFANVIDADYYDLIKVDGVGPESALFFNVLSSIRDRYLKSKQEQEKIELNSTQKCVEFFRKYYSIKTKEFMVMVCLNKFKKVIRVFKYEGHSEIEVAFDIRQISHNINDNGVCSIVLFHTHPQGSVLPSMQDLKTTQRIVNICLNDGIDFDDHIILNESEHYSFNKKDLINEMKRKYVTVFGDGFVDERLMKQARGEEEKV